MDGVDDDEFYDDDSGPLTHLTLPPVPGRDHTAWKTTDAVDARPHHRQEPDADHHHHYDCYRRASSFLHDLFGLGAFSLR